MESSNIKPKHIAAILATLILSGVCSFWFLGDRTLDPHECFVSVTAREMLHSGDWIWPTFNGQSRLQKTPLCYWLVAGASKITGRVDEFTARLPCALSAVLSAALMIFFLRRSLGVRSAIICSAVWATSLGCIRYARNARPEMAMTFFVLVCFLSFYEAINSKRRNASVIYSLIFWISLGFGNLAKGPAPLPIVLLPLGAYIIIFRRFRAVRRIMPITGLAICLAISLPWFLAVAARLDWNLTLWKKEFFDRFFGEYARGDYPWYYYFGVIWKYIAPWVAFLPFAVFTPFNPGWGNRQKDIFYFWIIFVVGFFFLTIDAGKRQHYILPYIPMVCVLIGVLIEDMVYGFRTCSHGSARGMLVWHICTITVFAVAAAIYFVFIKKTQTTAVVVLSSLAIFCSVVTGGLFYARLKAAGLAGVFVSVTAMFIAGYYFYAEQTDESRYMKEFALKVKSEIPNEAGLVCFGELPQVFVHYYGKVVPQITDRRQIDAEYSAGSWVLVSFGDIEALVNDGGMNVIIRKDKIIEAEHDWPLAVLAKIKTADLEPITK